MHDSPTRAGLSAGPVRRLWEAVHTYHPQTETYDIRARNRVSKSTLRSETGSQKYFSQLLLL